MNNTLSYKLFSGALGTLFLFVAHFNVVSAAAVFPTGGRGNQQEVDRSLRFADGEDTLGGLERTTSVCMGAANENYLEIALWDKQERKYDNRVFASLEQSDFERQRQGSNRKEPRDVNMKDKLGKDIVKLRAVGAKNNPEEPCTGIEQLDINLQKFLFWDFGEVHEENPGEISFSTGADQFRSDFAQAGIFARGDEPLRERNLLISDTADLFPTLSSKSRQGAYFIKYGVIAKARRSDRTYDTETRTFELYIVYGKEKYNFPSNEEDYNKKEKVLIDAFDKIQSGLSLGMNLQSSAQEAFDTSTVADFCVEDVDQNSMINIVDLVRVARAFGSQVPGYAEDVNGDGRVNIIDLVTVARRFGQRCDSAAYSPNEPQRVVFVPVPIAKQSQNLGFASVLKSIFWVIGQ